MKMTHTVRVKKQCGTFGKTGEAHYVSECAKWEVEFSSPWVGYYTTEELEFLD